MYDDPVETFEMTDGKTLKVFIDTDASNPRKEGDNLGTFVAFHSRYLLGDINPRAEEHSASSWEEYVCQEFFPKNREWPEDDDETFQIALKEFETNYISLPVYLYDHSGLALNTTGFHCPWDSGQVGYIYISKDRAREEYGWRRLSKSRIKRIEGYLRGEIEIQNDFVSGSVYGYQIVDENDEIIDSCWGFFGYDHEKSGLFDNAGYKP